MMAVWQDYRTVQITPEDRDYATFGLPRNSPFGHFRKPLKALELDGDLATAQELACLSTPFDHVIKDSSCEADDEKDPEITPRISKPPRGCPRSIHCDSDESSDLGELQTPIDKVLHRRMDTLKIKLGHSTDSDDTHEIGGTNDADDEYTNCWSTVVSDADEDKDETEDIFTTKEIFEAGLADMLHQMMFVSGETAEPSIDTTTLIEDITRQQVIEILTRSTQLATRRGSRAISTDDLIFLIRHDKAKVSRLRTFLSWKDVRKNVKDSDDKGGGDAADFAGADDAAGIAAGPQDVAAKPKNKRAKVGLAWDIHSFFSVQIPERDDEEDEEEEEQNYATLQRLAAADERTKHMTKEEYVFWSECRQASFTYRKSKRFREWAGFGIVTESKPNDDIVDILGFLTFEIVQTLTEEALKVKEREDHEKNRGGADTTGENAKKRKRETSLFDPPEEGRTPIEPRHVREAYRKLQATPQKSVAMLLHNGRLPARMNLRLVNLITHLKQ
ncbi:hypothetical protein N7478_001209 [Penicillium angulare]|uniref:uncharacterized protein n=1 Tax=Penicillium angulare TaxID=116970 RepID=UPI00253FC0FB|nr:uncharacterized protein N7478_001209 [Penicillium angulare]KAJ5291958.1 hypothetical protein N7478_001209 [Penicillium angulare]